MNQPSRLARQVLRFSAPAAALLAGALLLTRGAGPLVDDVAGLLLIGAAIVIAWFIVSARGRSRSEREAALGLERDLRADAVAARLRLTNVLESITDAFAILDGAWRVVYVNEEGTRLADRTRDELVGQVLWDAFPEALGTPFETACRRAVSERRVMQIEAHDERTGRWLSIRIYPSEDGVSILSRDVTDAKMLDAQLRELEGRWVTLRDADIVGVCVAGRDGRIEEANDRFLRMAGATRDDVISGRLTWGAIIPPDHGGPARQANEEAARHGAFTPFETELTRPGGGRVPVLLGGAVLQDGVRTVALALDLTALKEREADRARALDSEKAARAEAEEANLVKDQFLATVSHELRTPLTAIYGWARLAQSGRLSAKELIGAIETIERNARSLAQLVEDLLDVSRIVTGKLRIETRLMAVNTIVHDAVDALVPAAEAKHVKLDRAVPVEPITIHGDAERVKQMVWNLVSNAIKFTPGDGRVRVEVRRDGGFAVIEVSDSGQGIGPEFLPHVFARFRQAEAGTNRSYTGLGLGLAITRHLVELHGGTVAVESAGRALGSRFIIRLPIVAAEESSRPAPRTVVPIRPRGGERALAGLRILAVDDDADTLALVKTTLERAGADVGVALSAAEAMTRLEGRLPDVLVSDIGMPGEDGYALVRKIRQRFPRSSRRLATVALTAYARVEDRNKALSRGFQMHVPKPIEPRELVEIVASLTRRSRNEVRA